MVGKLRAAVEARRDPDLLIIARTDAVAVTGVDDAIARARAFAEAGADVLFVEAPTSEDDIARVAKELRGVAPLVFNWAEGGRTPPLSLERITELGFSLVIYPIGTLLAATAGIRALLATLQAEGTPVSALPGLPGVRRVHRPDRPARGTATGTTLLRRLSSDEHGALRAQAAQYVVERVVRLDEPDERADEDEHAGEEPQRGEGGDRRLLAPARVELARPRG